MMYLFYERYLYGYVPRDYINLEMRHQYVLFIDCFIVLLFLFAGKGTLFLSNVQIISKKIFKMKEKT